MESALVIDTETTDKDPATCSVVELAWKPWGVGVTAECLRFSPEQPMKIGAVATHHILPSELIDLPSSSLAPTTLPPTNYWIGHNIDFDWRALGSPPIKRICTLALSRALYPESDSHSLSSMMYFLFGMTERTREVLCNAHSAAADVLMCERVFAEIWRHKGLQSLEQAWALSEDSRIPKIMTFGKFKGQPIEKVDRGYANWYRRQEDTDPYVLEAFRRAGLI